MDESPLAFEPVPLRSRCDGWTAARQCGFIHGLRHGLKAGAAAERVSMRRQGAYALRARPGAESFAAAWDEAAAQAERLRIAAHGGRRSLYERAVTGVARPVVYRKRIVAVERRYDSAALIRLLGMLARAQPKSWDGGERLYFPLDDELLSAFTAGKQPGRPTDRGGRGTIGGGGIAVHPLQSGHRPSGRPE